MTDSTTTAQQLASSMWEDVDWLEAQDKAAREAPYSVGVPLSLIGEATSRMAAKIDAALRSAESQGEARGRVQGLREAAEYVKECREPRAVVQTFDVMARQIAARADAIEQEQK